jgi:CRP-like cAMP-binding protein
MEPLEHTLAQHPFLAGLDRGYLRQLACFASGKQFKPLQMIFHEGNDANQFYLIREGKVALEMPLLGCDAVQIQTLGPGEALGWSWLVPPYHWHFSARAVEPTSVIVLDGQALRAKCEADHHLGYEVLKRFVQVVVQRLEATRNRIVEVPDVQPTNEGPLARHFAEFDE